VSLRHKKKRQMAMWFLIMANISEYDYITAIKTMVSEKPQIVKYIYLENTLELIEYHMVRQFYSNAP
jgi:hypothetical protein